MKLNNLRGKFGSSKTRIRLGRGPASGKGKTCGRGHKGQKSRSGMSVNGFEGGQMPIYRRLPKRGFNVLSPKKLSVVNTGRLQDAINAGRLDAKNEINGSILEVAGLVRRQRQGIRLLAKGDLGSKVNIKVDYASKAAIEVVKKAGGEVILPILKKEQKDEDSMNEKVQESSSDTEVK